LELKIGRKEQTEKIEGLVEQNLVCLKKVAKITLKQEASKVKIVQLKLDKDICMKGITTLKQSITDSQEELTEY